MLARRRRRVARAAARRAAACSLIFYVAVCHVRRLIARRSAARRLRAGVSNARAAAAERVTPPAAPCLPRVTAMRPDARRGWRRRVVLFAMFDAA